jgi:hypothetical protein
MSQREPEHREPRYKGEGYDTDGMHGDGKGYSGSPAHRSMTNGPGPVPGAGELAGIGGPGPGSEGRSVRPDPVENPTRKTPDSKTKAAKGDDTSGGEED